MTVGRKLRYEIDLTQSIPAVEKGRPKVRPITTDDLDGLARLMLDAYIDTIDYGDEDLGDALDEVRSFFENGHALLDHSYLVEMEGTIASAILVSLGLARLATTTSIRSLAESGYEKVALYITDGNQPSEALFRSVGAVQIPSEEPHITALMGG